jgi:glutaminase
MIIGKEPSGKSFNAMELNRNNIPHNPMLNAGAIMACSLVLPEKYLFERYEYIINIWKKLAVTSQVQFNNSVYLSEKDTAHRNFCLGHMMMEKKVCLFSPSSSPTQFSFLLSLPPIPQYSFTLSCCFNLFKGFS